ncbi:MAG: alpha/beta fold hydrolase [Bacteroidota bacterium]
MQLHFQSYGQGPALIILHGLFGSLDNWVSHARKLANDFSVYTIDQRNHGKSPHADRWDYDVMAEDLAEFMDQQGIMQAHLLGHSMGGKTVMKLAGSFPERIDKLIVVDMAPKAYSPHHTHIIETLLAVPLSSLSSRKEAELFLADRIDEWSVRQFLLKGLGRDDQKNFRWKFNLNTISLHYPRILEAVELEEPFEGPTLFLSGGKSEYVQVSDWPNIRDHFPFAQFEVLEEAGHWVHAEAPEAFLQTIRHFLL